MVQWVKCLLCRHKDRVRFLRTHVKAKHSSTRQNSSAQVGSGDGESSGRAVSESKVESNG